MQEMRLLKTAQDIARCTGIDSKQRAYFDALIQGPTTELIKNALTKIHILQVGKQLFPLSINEAEYHNSYICSPFSAMQYGKHEVHKCHWLLEACTSSLINFFTPFLKLTRINKVVIFNNWLFSTNIYPKMEERTVKEIIEFLTRSFPDHALIFPHLNSYRDAALIETLHQEKCYFISIRNVTIFDKKMKNYLEEKNTQRDLALLDKTSFQIVSHDEIFPEDYPRIVQLYNQLYLEKYSTYHPQFTEKFIKLCHKNRVLKMRGIRNQEGELEGIVCNFFQDNLLCMSIFGYNMQLSQELGVYRMLIAMCIQEIEEGGSSLHAGAGAEYFKRLRGGVKFVDYGAIYDKHLPLHRKACWQVINGVYGSICARVLEHNQF